MVTSIAFVCPPRRRATARPRPQYVALTQWMTDFNAGDAEEHAGWGSPLI
jgi:hypothetical protein